MKKRHKTLRVFRLSKSKAAVVSELEVLHQQIRACKACPLMRGPPVHGPAIATKVMIFGQAPGPHEGDFGKPFAWTAGKTLFRWFHSAMGLDEETFRAEIYISAVARCFPGKAPGGGDRKPNATEIATCSHFVAREMDILVPQLVIPIGTLAIEQVLGRKAPLAETIGRSSRVKWHGVAMDVIPLPHPSGASPWHKVEPGRSLLHEALALIAQHPAMSGVLKKASARIHTS